MKRLLFLFSMWLIFVLCSASVSFGQYSEPGKNHRHLEDPHKYHVGIASIATHVTGESGIAPGFHIHFIRQLGHHYRWGLGVGYEAIADEHWHNGLNLMANYRPASFLSLLAGPGLSLKKHHGDTEILPAFHTEAVFEFNLRGIHVGPLIGYGFDKEESHISVGLHIGLGL